MSKTYAEKLRDPRWQKKRLEVLERDGWRCLKCQSTENELHVHHKKYKSGAAPWEYRNDQLQTLCRACHEEITETNKIIATELEKIPYEWKLEIAEFLDLARLNASAWETLTSINSLLWQLRFREADIAVLKTPGERCQSDT